VYFGEFIGLPGSGKTTIRKNLKKRLAGEDQTIIFCENAFYKAMKNNTDDNPSKFLLSIIPQTLVESYLPSLVMKFQNLFRTQCEFLAEEIELFNLLTDRSVFRNLSCEGKADIIDFFLRTSIYYRTISNFIKDERFVIFDDEAFVQRSISVFVLGPETNIAFEKINITRYFEIVPLPNILFYIECDIATCIQRMKKRSTGFSKRLRGMDDQAVYNFLNIFNQYYNNIFKLLEKHKIKIVRINSNHSPLQNVDQIVDELDTFSDTHRGI